MQNRTHRTKIVAAAASTALAIMVSPAAGVGNDDGLHGEARCRSGRTKRVRWSAPPRRSSTFGPTVRTSTPRSDGASPQRTPSSPRESPHASTAREAAVAGQSRLRRPPNRQEGSRMFAFQLELEDGTTAGGYTAAVPNWKPGDTIPV